MLGAWCKIWIYCSFFNHFCMAQPVISKLLQVPDFKKWFPVGILRYRIYYGKIYIWQHSVYYSVLLHCSWIPWKMFTVVRDTLFQEKETQATLFSTHWNPGALCSYRTNGQMLHILHNDPQKQGTISLLHTPWISPRNIFFLNVVCLSSGWSVVSENF